jgi:hypothetical protein
LHNDQDSAALPTVVRSAATRPNRRVSPSRLHKHALPRCVMQWAKNKVCSCKNKVSIWNCTFEHRMYAMPAKMPSEQTLFEYVGLLKTYGMMNAD